MSQIQWTTVIQPSIKVSLIQGNIPQELKWTPEYLQSTLQHYYKATQEHWDSQLIIWPETAIPLLKKDATEFIKAVDQDAKQHHAAIITGIPISEELSGKYYNAMIALGTAQGTYYKQHLVPFGEFIPFAPIIGRVLDLFNIPMSDFSSGTPTTQPMRINDKIIAPFICYEIVYEQTALSLLPQANVLITISNDAWFEHSFASAQHLQMGQLRALETGRYHLFTTNSGITAIINPQGKIQASLPEYQPAILTGDIHYMTGSTPIVWLGIWPIIGFLIGLLIIARWRSINIFNELVSAGLLPSRK